VRAVSSVNSHVSMLGAITRVMPSHMLTELSETIMGSGSLGRLLALILLMSILIGMSAVKVTGSVGAAGSSEITGTVTDQQGALLPDAAVFLLSDAMRIQQTRSGPNGEFVFHNVGSGQYVVEVQRAGFARADETISVKAAPVRLSIQKRVVGPGQQVNVTAEVDSFRPEESSTATKASIPLNEIPQGIGVRS
jgi:Carboxypeptidase regulatory-like domain